MVRAPLAELSVGFVDGRRMAALHRRFSAVGTATDVLSFPLDCDSRGRVIGGEVVVCLAVASAEAAKRRRPVRNEILLYALHGMLHLCGWDDKTPAGYTAMHKIEDKILKQLGIGAVFAAGTPTGDRQ